MIIISKRTGRITHDDKCRGCLLCHNPEHPKVSSGCRSLVIEYLLKKSEGEESVESTS